MSFQMPAPRQFSGLLMDEPTQPWHPATISDRKLLELRQRLGKVRQLGDAFAEVTFSEQAQSRLRELDKQG